MPDASLSTPRRPFVGADYEFTIDGWSYWTEVEDEDDNRKISHFAVSDDGRHEVRALDYSPYFRMTRTTFRRFVEAGFPTRVTRGAGRAVLAPLRDDDVQRQWCIAAIDEGGIAIRENEDERRFELRVLGREVTGFTFYDDVSRAACRRQAEGAERAAKALLIELAFS